jgi:heat shock protein HtpX
MIRPLAMNPPANLAPEADTAVARLAVLAVMLVVGSYVITLLLAAACIYLPILWITYSPSIYALMALLAGLVLSGIMVTSLIPRRDKFAPPGACLQLSRQPRLFAEINQIAKSLGEELPSDIFAVLDVNAWVAERGGWMGIGDHRVMGLGLPLLQVLTVSQFRAVLAHEFSHYYTGDTSLAPWVYRARASMALTLSRLESRPEYIRLLTRNAGAAAVYFIVIGILSFYWKLLLRTTMLVSRRQEFRADQLACWMAGSAALVEGLSTIPGASAVFPLYWQHEVLPVLQQGCRPPILEGFKEFLTSPDISGIVSNIVTAELKGGKTNPEDTHPPLGERIAAAELLPERKELRNELPAISLVEDLPLLELQILEALNSAERVSKLRPVKWEEVGVSVYIPKWRETVREYAPHLAGVTVISLPEKIANLNELAARITSPKGMLFDSEQRREYAIRVLWMSLALALIDSGWDLHARPGQCFLTRDGMQIVPAKIVHDLTSGTLSREEWTNQCQAADIASLDISEAARSSTAQG